MKTSATDRTLSSALLALATGLDAGATLNGLISQPAIAATLPERLAMPLREVLSSGGSAVEAFTATGLLLPHELAVIGAAERTGRLHTGIAQVAAGIERRREDARALVSSLAYPVFLIAASTVILPLPLIVTGGVGAYLARAIWAPLIIGGAIVTFGFWLPRLPATDPRRELPRRIARRIPFLRGALRRVDAGIFARVLGQCVTAGLGIFEALDSASASVQDAALRRGARAARARLESGSGLADALAATGAFPVELAALVAQGELTGTLDVALDRAAEEQARAGRRSVRRFLVGLVGVVYAVVVLFIAWQIISGFIGVLETVEQAVEF